ncbi:glycosyltransferase [Nitrospira lenta]|nr:glycosyltransferase [Nitrospira lenta]
MSSIARSESESCFEDAASMNTSTSCRPGKVVHVIGALAAGGAERFVSELVPHFIKCGIDVALIILSNRVDAVGSQMLLDLKRAGIKLHTGPTVKVGARTVLWYIHKLFEQKPSIVHLHTPNTELAHYLATRFYRYPHRIYRTLHSVKPPDALAMRLAIRANKAAISIACGEAVYQAHRKVMSDRIITVENGVRFNWPIRTDEISSAAKLKHGFKNNQFHFLIVGRMNHWNRQNSIKGHDTLIDAWKRGKLGERDCILHIVGDGDLRQKLTTLAEGDNSIIFHGIQSNVHEWLLAADCFVMPSRYEGLPIAGIEAAGTGLPCVFSDIAPLRELKVPQVLWVPVGDPEALSHALSWVAMERPSVDTAEVNQFRKRFDIKDVAQRYAELYLR